MQFKVPQNVQREDTIVGPLTLRQLIICAIGFTISYGIYVSLAKFYLWITWLPPVAIITLITLAFAFLRPLDLSFTKYVLLFIEFSLLPKKRLWIKASGEFIVPEQTAGQIADQKKKDQKTEDEIMDKQKKLDELEKFLESQKDPSLK